MSDKFWIGVDLGGTKVLAALFDHTLNLIATAKKPTNSQGGPSAVFESVQQAVDEVLAGRKFDQVGGLGFGVPGQVTPNSTTVRFAPNLDWHDLEVRTYLPATWTCPIVLHNDTRMATYGEFALGAAKGAKNVFGIFAGTGIGGGLILNGQLYEGFLGHAGEIGHVIVQWKKNKSLEMIAGRKSMMIRAKKRIEKAPKAIRKNWKDVDLDQVKSSQLAEKYNAGDPIAIEVVHDACQALGGCIASVINLLSPEVIVVGGGVAEALGNSFIERIWEKATPAVLPKAAEGVKFLPAALGDLAGVTGCAAYAQMKVSKK